MDEKDLIILELRQQINIAYWNLLVNGHNSKEIMKTLKSSLDKIDFRKADQEFNLNNELIRACWTSIDGLDRKARSIKEILLDIERHTKIAHNYPNVCKECGGDETIGHLIKSGKFKGRHKTCRFYEPGAG